MLNNSSASASSSSSSSSNKLPATQDEIYEKLCAIHTLTSGTDDKLAQYMEKNDLRADKAEKQTSSNTKQIKILSKKIDSMERASIASTETTEKAKQQQLQNNITLMNVPVMENESLHGLVVSLGEALGVQMSNEDISAVYRVRNSKNNLIVVKFKSFNIKSNIISRAKEGNLNLASFMSCDIEAGNQQVFINHHVTPYFGKLQAIGRNAVKDKKIFSCWINSKGLMVKLSSDDAPRAFTTADTLITYINSNTNSSNNGSNDTNTQATSSNDRTAKKAKRRPDDRSPSSQGNPKSRTNSGHGRQHINNSNNNSNVNI